MPKCSLIATILPLLAFSMALGGQAPSDWTGLRRFFRQQIGHSGNQNGFLSHLYVHRQSRTAYVIAFNTDVPSQSRSRPRITRDVDDAVRDRVLETLAAKR